LSGSLTDTRNRVLHGNLAQQRLVGQLRHGSLTDLFILGLHGQFRQLCLVRYLVHRLHGWRAATTNRQEEDQRENGNVTSWAEQALIQSTLDRRFHRPHSSLYY